MKLAELQQLAQSHVLAGGSVPDALTAAVAPPAEERWAIYSEGYRLRLIEALANQYPVLGARLGSAGFESLATEFIAATPSRFRSVRDYGADLGAFIRAAAATIEHRMLAELADFEWLLAASFDAADATATVAADLAALAPQDWPELRFAAVPSLRRSTTLTNAVAIWRALHPGTEADEAELASAAMDTPPRDARSEPPASAQEPVEWLSVRRELKTEFRSLEEAEARALDTLLGGATFGELCEELAGPYREGAALQAASWLKGWLQGGLLRRV